MLRTHLCVFALCSTVVSSAFAQPSSTSSSSPVSLYGAVSGDPTGVQGVSSTEPAVPTAVQAQTAKRAEFVIAPMPMVNPTLENGISVVGGVLYRLDPNDRETAPSVTGLAGFKTSNDSWGVAAIQSLHLAHDKVRVLAVAAYGDVNYAFYGIGQDAGDSGLSVELNQAGGVLMTDGLLRVWPQWYVGARYQVMHMTVTTDPITIPGGPTLPGADADIRTASLGPRVDFDSRDNPFYPRRGTQIRGIVNFYGEAIGGNRNYQSYEAWVSRYHSIAPKHVLAWHASVCGVDGPVPFYDLCMLGKSQDLRGYAVGQYRDRALLAAQAEWRSELWWRFGATAFFGEGAVAPGLGSFTWDSLLPGGGLGLRFTLAQRNHVNLRADYAWGKDSTALYVGVIEAF